VIENLKINNFRNIKFSELNFNPNLNIFIGLNGQGKTNVLEAVQISLSGSSFRNQERIQWIKLGEEFSGIHSSFLWNQVKNQTRILISSSDRKIFLNEKIIAPFKYKNLFSPVVFDPSSLNTIKESGEIRRSFIDEISLNLFEKSGLVQNDYKKILKIRNKTLKEVAEGLKKFSDVKLYLESLNPMFIEKSVALIEQRQKTLNSIILDVNLVVRSLFNNAEAHIDVEYLISGLNYLSKNSSELSNVLENRLFELSAQELALGTSLIGPHKHDIKILFNGNDSRFFCSQGQQRTLILAFKMAQIVYHQKVRGCYPILILDDVLSELDDEKRDALIDFLDQLPTQIFISSTNYDLPTQFKTGVGKVFWVSEGKVNEYGATNELRS
jgi:DNA replication and repair protein RecF